MSGAKALTVVAAVVVPGALTTALAAVAVLGGLADAVGMVLSSNKTNVKAGAGSFNLNQRTQTTWHLRCV